MFGLDLTMYNYKIHKRFKINYKIHTKTTKLTLLKAKYRQWGTNVTRIIITAYRYKMDRIGDTPITLPL